MEDREVFHAATSDGSDNVSECMKGLIDASLPRFRLCFIPRTPLSTQGASTSNANAESFRAPIRETHRTGTRLSRQSTPPLRISHRRPCRMAMISCSRGPSSMHVRSLPSSRRSEGMPRGSNGHGSERRSKVGGSDPSVPGEEKAKTQSRPSVPL